MPRMTYDPEADAAYLYLASKGSLQVFGSEEVFPGIVLDLSMDGQIVGVEILSASKTLAPGDWSRSPVPDNLQVNAAEQGSPFTD
jgi:uncharacterized protein YuzE